MNILLVDDESYVTESLRETIPWEEIGIQAVYQASSAFMAIDRLEELDIDIVVTDVRMPEMSGLELIGTITERWPHIRCILLTGYSDFEYAKQAVQLQASAYILKPVDDREFIHSIAAAIRSIQEERMELERYYKLLHSWKSDLGHLRTRLLQDLALGRELSVPMLTTKLVEYEIAFDMNRDTAMLLIQLGSRFTGLDEHSAGLMEYALVNMAEEVFKDRFHIWCGKAPHHCMILLAQMREDGQGLAAGSGTQPAEVLLQGYAEQLQHHVSSYLKGEISVLVTPMFRFPGSVADTYRAALSSLYVLDQSDRGEIRFMNEAAASSEVLIQAVAELDQPPALYQLLETRQWEDARGKLEAVFAVLEQACIGQAQLYGVFLHISNAYMYIAHKQGYLIHQLDQAGWDPLYIQQLIQSVSKLRAWSLDMLDKLVQIDSGQDQRHKSRIVRQVQDMVAAENGHELSVKTIADRVYLHPVYLSKIYKSETGEGLGDYIIRKRMERALYLLKHTNKRIYEITAELGYQNPQYFSKMFRKLYGMTPHEYREQ